MLAILHWRCRPRQKPWLAALVLGLMYSSCCAQTADDQHNCPIEILSLKDSAPFTFLTKDEQAKALRALSDDIAEMAEIDMAASQSSRGAYRNYFVGHLQFKVLPRMRTARCGSFALHILERKPWCRGRRNWERAREAAGASE
jgi:hypothetical protein